MPYAQKSDLVTRFGEQELIQLTDRVSIPPSTIDDTVLDRALDDASGLIDGYLGKVYALPLPTVPANLVKLACDVARYYLRGESAEKDGAVARAYGEAVTWLRDVSLGRVKLDDGGTTPPVAPGSAGRVQASPPVFTRDSLRGF